MQTLTRHIFILTLLTAALSTSTPLQGARAPSRIKDISRIAGLESIDLIGYGIVTGLRGTGDKDIALSKQTMANLMENFQLTLSVDDIKSKNVAAVAVTAKAHPFHKEGDRIDVEISSLGDASSLEGGILLMTPLLDPNGDVYALAQGPLTVGGFSAGKDAGGGQTVSKNHTTTATGPGAALLKYGQTAAFCQSGILRLVLRHPDFTTADRMAAAINSRLGGIAMAKDASTVAIRIPQDKIDMGQTAAFVAQLEVITLTPDAIARVIVNERTGTIVMGGEVHIGEAVVAHGNLTVSVKESLLVSQPTGLALSQNIVGENIEAAQDQSAIRTVVVPDVTTTVDEEQSRVMIVPSTTTVKELADTLHLMGATPRDLISILQALHRIGALQMELVAM